MDSINPNDKTNGKRNRRFPLQKITRPLELVFRIGLVLTCLFTIVLGLVMLFSDRPRMDYRVCVAMIVVAVVALPVGFFVIGFFFARINKAISKKTRPPEKGDGETQQDAPDETFGWENRAVAGIAGAILIGAGIFAGVNGRISDSRGSNPVEAPVLCWIIGGLLILIGVHFLYGAVFTKNKGDSKSADRTEQPLENEKPQ